MFFSRQDGEVYLYGIFDGHSGSKVAAFAAQRMPEEILLGQLHGKVTDDEIKDVLKQVTVLLYFFRDVPDFSFPNPAGAGAGFQNLVQRKTTPELQ